MRKIFVLCAALLLVLGFGKIAQAANERPAEVYVQNVSLGATTYKAGDTVTGSFILANAHQEMNIPDVMYEVSLVGEFQANGLPGVFYDTKTYGPLFLKTGEANKLVSFSYQLPSTYNGNKLGIHIRAILKTGVPLGFAMTPVSVTGGGAFAVVTKANVVVDGATFGSQAGPMIYPEKKGTVTATISNPSSESLTVTPHVIIHERSTSGKTVIAYDETPFTVNAKKTQNLSFALPTFNNKAGVYLGEVRFVDAAGVERATPFYFRYIVAGDMVTITGLTTTTPTAPKGGSINLTLSYAGAPYDILTGETPSSGPADLSITVRNERDQIVGTYAENMDFNVGTSKDIAITSSHESKALKAEVVITKAGKELARYETELSPNYQEASQNADTSIFGQKEHEKIWYVLIPVLLTIIVIALFIYFRQKMFGRKVMIFVFGIVAAGTILVASSRTTPVHAFTVTSQKNVTAVWNFIWKNPNPNKNVGTHGYYPFSGTIPWYYVFTPHNGVTPNFVPQVSINTPTDNQNMTPGQTFRVTGTTWAVACDNAPQDIEISVSFKGVKKTQIFTNVNNSTANDSHDIATSPHKDFSIGPFTVPSATGPHQITVKIDNYNNLPDRDYNGFAKSIAHQQPTPVTWDTFGGELIGYQTINVASPKPTVQIHANPTHVPGGGSSKLTWSSTNATSCTATGDWLATGAKAINNSTGESTGALTTDKTYTIKCTGTGGTSAPASATVTVDDAPTPRPTVTLTATPDTIDYGENSNLTWTSTNATECHRSGGGVFNTGGATNNNSGVSTGSLTETTDYFIICTGPGGTSAPGEATVTVNGQISRPTVTLWADPNPVGYGDASHLKWSSTDTSECHSDDFETNGDTDNTSSGVSTGPLTTATTYIITCTGPGGTRDAQTTVNVNQPAGITVRLYTDTPLPITKGQSAVLKWTSENATECHRDGGAFFDTDGDTSNTSGVSTGALTADNTTYNIKCTGNSTPGYASLNIPAVNPNITASCKAYNASNQVVTSIKQNTNVTWKVTAQSGATYAWEGSDGSNSKTQADSGDYTFTTSYSTSGIKTMSVDISLNGTVVKTVECTDLTVRVPPTFIEF